MTAPALRSEVKRVRASERAVTAALKAMKNAGLSVEKLCVVGGQINIHAATIENSPDQTEDSGIEQW